MGEDKYNYNYSNNVKLPPGFRFYPGDEELLHFLSRKTTSPASADVIPHLDLYSYDPWQLNGKALREGNQWYLYSKKRRAHENWRSYNGYWEALDIKEELITSSASTSTNAKVVGVKKYYVFRHGPASIKTTWIMQEYSLLLHSSSPSSSPSPTTGKWVLCRVYEQIWEDMNEGTTELSFLDQVFLSLDDFDEISSSN